MSIMRFINYCYETALSQDGTSELKIKRKKKAK